MTVMSVGCVVRSSLAKVPSLKNHQHHHPHSLRYHTTCLRLQYKIRRDLFLDILSEEFDLTTSTGTSPMGAWAGCTIYTACSKPRASTFMSSLTGNSEKVSERKRMLSFVAHSSGMFLWVRIYCPPYLITSFCACISRLSASSS